MPFFLSQGHTLHYEVQGDGFPIIFIHPPAMGSAAFYHQQKLARGFKVILMDARGHGLSSSGRETLTISEWAEDVHNLADLLGLDQVLLCGYSSGGSTALEFALRWPERTAGVALAGGFPEVCTTLLEREFEIGIHITDKGWMGLLAWMLSVGNATQAEHRERIADAVKRSSAPLVRSLYESGLHYSCTAGLSSLSRPLLLLYGTRDWYVHYYQYMFYKYAVQAPKDIVMVQGVGHQIPTLQPGSYNVAVTQFARQLETGVFPFRAST
ncbi:alpha/beta hydrolase [Salibacterium halotolerans]|uniref:Pimeloyl-ACP methyl ester carboxylesterase n=1 Tax=Salibacterium halotolerans TaxID=1884432 RepID=A0A1I5V4M5_9BACI|nr:alpha/beta hydrolase [Salibacterium halotolerans]SFQ02473.1 Pimeloyl-ACP methyl ester carboxylesterase [Salibacterium halotolerans]